MDINVLPRFDHSVNVTNCCPKFNPDGWDDQRLSFRDKLFLRAETHSILHLPLDMGRVFATVLEDIAEAGAADPDQQLTLSRSLSLFRDEHLFAVTRPVPGHEMTTLSGEFVTKVFEGPFSDMGKWQAAMARIAEAHGATDKPVWFFYTTCPKCAKVYGQNYVVGLAQI